MFFEFKSLVIHTPTLSASIQAYSDFIITYILPLLLSFLNRFILLKKTEADKNQLPFYKLQEQRNGSIDRTENSSADQAIQE